MSIEPTLFNADDPRLTAYALGELSDPAECAQVEQLLAASPEARAELADIRSLTAALTAEYEQERNAATADETTPANVVLMPGVDRRRSAWSRFSPWWQIAAVLMVIAAGVWSIPTYDLVQASARKSTAQQDARAIARAQAGAPASPQLAQAAPAATPSSPLLAQHILQLSPAPELADRDVRELVVPPGQPLPTNLPPGTTAVYGPSPVTGVVGGNATTSGPGGSSPLLLAKNKEARDFFISDKDTAAASQSGADNEKSAPAPPSPLMVAAAPVAASSDASMSSASTYTGGASVAAGTVTVARPTARFAEARAKSLAETARGWELPKTSDTVNPTTALAPETAPADRIVVTGSNIPTSEEVGARTVDTVDKAKRGRTGQEDVQSVITRSDPAISSGGGNLDGSSLVILDGRRTATNTADYAHTVENPFLAAKENPLSTFSIDVDTASYAIVRRFIDAGSLPPPDAVRVEEMLNYFPYADAPPAPDSDKPFAIHLEAAACPWNTAHRLVRISLKGKEIENDKRPASNLVFLLDVSGSMMPEERLPLIKKSLRLLVDRLREDDHVAIVVYAGESGLALPPTSGDHKDAILRAIEHLHAGGSTNGASGIKLAYNVARKGFIKGGTNRVILATDGDFNVGVTSHADLLRLIETERKDGVFLSVLGVGTDNLKDSTMQTLADHGNGNYNYLDRLEEGRKVLVNQMSGTLVTIAKDVKIQVEFNPAAVASYRLIGYEKRMLKKEDFNDDRIDAGEIGAGHNVTALYEVVPVGQPGGGGEVDPLKYQPAPVVPEASIPHPRQTALPEMLTVKMRHKAPDSDTSERSYEEGLIDRGAPGDYGNASADFRFAAAVASFGMVLRDSPHRGDATLGSALELAQAGKGEDANGYRTGFIELVRQAQALRQEHGR